MPKNIHHSKVLNEGTLTEVDEALRDLKENPAVLTPELKAQVAQFLVDTLVRIYKYGVTGSKPSAIPLTPFGDDEGTSDPADDDMLFRQAALVLTSEVPAVNAALERYRHPDAHTASGRLHHRASEVPEMLQSVFDKLCQSSYAPLSDAAREARARIREQED